jgi:hypothetical protein
MQRINKRFKPFLNSLIPLLSQQKYDCLLMLLYFVLFLQHK